MSLIANKLRRNIVEVSVDPRGFVERENETQTEIKIKTRENARLKPARHR